MRLNLRPWGGASRLLGSPWSEPEASQWQPGQTQFPLEEPGVGYFTADAYISGTVPRSGSLTADAVLSAAPTPPAPPPTEFTADAVIRALTPDFEDDFNRVVASGYGTNASDGTPYANFSEPGGSGTTSVDGSQLVVDNTGAFYYSTVEIPSLDVWDGATLQFDFYVGADPSEYIYYELAAFGVLQRWTMYVEGGSSTWFLNFQWISQSFMPDPSTWYTAKVAYGEGGGSASKVWKRGDPEPDWQVVDTHPDVLDQGSGFATSGWFVENDGTDLAMVDNARAYRTGAFIRGAQLTADAVRRRTIGDGSTTTPSFVGSSKATGGAGLVALPKPDGLAVGDLMVVVMRSQSVTTPDGWVLTQPTFSYESFNIYVLTRVADAGDVAGPSFNLAIPASPGFPAYGHLVAWRNASAIELFQNSTFGVGSPATATDTWVGVAGTAVQITWAQIPTSATITTPPTGMTLAEFERGMGTYYELYPAQGQLGTKSATWSSATTIEMLQLHITGRGRFLTADAVLIPITGQTTVEGSFTADAWLTRTQNFTFTADAIFIRGGRTRHSSALHFGTMPDSVVVLSAAVGAATQGSTLHEALVELESRISARENTGA